MRSQAISIEFETWGAGGIRLPLFQIEVSVVATVAAQFISLSWIPEVDAGTSLRRWIRNAMNRIMRPVSKIWQRMAVVLSLSALMIIVGCGDDGSGLGRRYPVKGKVTYKGAPVAHGTVNFLPTKPPPEGRAATGEIKDGYYSAHRRRVDYDGALPGEYNVAIVALDVDLASAASSKEQGGMIHQGDAAYQKAVKCQETYPGQVRHR